MRATLGRAGATLVVGCLALACDGESVTGPGGGSTAGSTVSTSLRIQGTVVSGGGGGAIPNANVFLGTGGYFSLPVIHASTVSDESGNFRPSGSVPGPLGRLRSTEIRGRAAAMAVASQVLAEFCHVVTDPRRFERPLEMFEALELCEQWWSAEECQPVAIDTEASAILLNCMHELLLGRTQLLDTLLAAAYYRVGVTRLATTDWRDFERYGVFQLTRL